MVLRPRRHLSQRMTHPRRQTGTTCANPARIICCPMQASEIESRSAALMQIKLLWKLNPAGHPHSVVPPASIRCIVSDFRCDAPANWGVAQKIIEKLQIQSQAQLVTLAAQLAAWPARRVSGIYLRKGSAVRTGPNRRRHSLGTYQY